MQNYLAPFADSQPVMHAAPPQQPWYRQPGYRPTNFLMDAAAKFIGQPMYDAYTGMSHALGYNQDPNAPEGHVTHQALNKGAQGLAEGALVGSAFARAPAGAVRSGFSRDTRNKLSGLNTMRQMANMQGDTQKAASILKQMEELRAQAASTDGGVRVETYEGGAEARSPRGIVHGKTDGDPQISGAYLANGIEPGQGHGKALYKAWAEHVNRPFRSDNTVTSDADVMYQHKLPEWGYNVIRNPEAVKSDAGIAAPVGQHVYRVEPPGQHTDDTFYANPFTGGFAPTYATPQEHRNINHLGRIY